MAQQLVRGTTGFGGGSGGTVNLLGWGDAIILPPVLLNPNIEDGQLLFPPSDQGRKLYLLNDGSEEIQISFGESFNPDSPLFLSPGYLFEEESQEELWGKGSGLLKRMERFRASQENPGGEAPPPSSPSLSILSEGEYAGQVFVPSGPITLSIVADQLFREDYNTEWFSFFLYRSESQSDFEDAGNLASFEGDFLLEPPDYQANFTIPFYPGNFYCLVAFQNFLMFDEICFLAYDEITNTLTLS